MYLIFWSIHKEQRKNTIFHEIYSNIPWNMQFEMLHPPQLPAILRERQNLENGMTSGNFDILVTYPVCVPFSLVSWMYKGLEKGGWDEENSPTSGNGYKNGSRFFSA